VAGVPTIRRELKVFNRGRTGFQKGIGEDNSKGSGCAPINLGFFVVNGKHRPTTLGWCSPPKKKKSTPDKEKEDQWKETETSRLTTAKVRQKEGANSKPTKKLFIMGTGQGG